MLAEFVVLVASGLNNPYGIAVGPDQAVYVCDVGTHRILKLPDTVVAGTGKAGYAGDGGPATEALLNEPYELTFDTAGNIFFVERLNNVVRRIDKKTGTISTFAGGFKQPHSLVFTPDGRLLICDIGNSRIQAVDARGTVTTLLSGLKGPRAFARDAKGVIYLALREGNAVYRLAGMTLVADKLHGPKGLACAPDGSVYIADTENGAIERVDSKGARSTVASGLKRPHGVAVGPDGTVYITDSENNRVLTLHIVG